MSQACLPAVELCGISKSYGDYSARSARKRNHAGATAGSVVALDNVSISVSRGDLHCIMGLSGCGKSTLLRIVNGLIVPTSGSVLVDGEKVLDQTPGELRELRRTKVSMVFQAFALLPHRTIIDNVAFGLEIRSFPKRERRERAAAMLERVGIGARENSYPHELSGGMRQRVGIARALVGEPKILLMDEPFSALDPIIRRQLQDEFLALTRTTGMTVLFVTHDLDEAIRIGSRISVMRSGRIVQTGLPAEILNSPANEYVAAFVRGVNAVHFPALRDLVLPGCAAGPVLSTSASLLDAADILLHQEAVTVIEDGDRPIGVITRRALIEGVASLNRNG